MTMNGVVLTEVHNQITKFKTYSLPKEPEKKVQNTTTYDSIKQSYLEFTRRLQFKRFRKCQSSSEHVNKLNTAPSKRDINNNGPVKRGSVCSDSVGSKRSRNNYNQCMNLKSSANETDENPSSSDETSRKHPNRRLKRERFGCEESQMGQPNMRLKEERVDFDETKVIRSKRIKEERVNCNEPKLILPNMRLVGESDGYVKCKRGLPNRRLKTSVGCDERLRNQLSKQVEGKAQNHNETKIHLDNSQMLQRVECDLTKLIRPHNRIVVGERVVINENILIRKHSLKRDWTDFDNIQPKSPSKRLAAESIESELSPKRARPSKRLVAESIESELPPKRARPSSKPKRVIAAVAKHLGFRVKRSKQLNKNTNIKSRLNLTRTEFADLDSPKGFKNTSGSNEICLDYKELLREYVVHNTEEEERKGETLYENRARKLLTDPTLIEFYIPPAQVEVIFQTMAQDRTAEESLRRICKLRKWPEPKIKCKYSKKGGYLSSCTVKRKKRKPKKGASNEELARELAALAWLEWLGFTQRVRWGDEALEETYFN